MSIENYHSDVEEKQELAKLERKLEELQLECEAWKRNCLKMYRALQKKNYSYQSLVNKYRNYKERTRDRMYFMAYGSQSGKERKKMFQYFFREHDWNQERFEYEDSVIDAFPEAEFWEALNGFQHHPLIMDNHKYGREEKLYGYQNFKGHDKYYHY